MARTLKMNCYLLWFLLFPVNCPASDRTTLI
jgi:hypothetical protein